MLKTAQTGIKSSYHDYTTFHVVGNSAWPCGVQRWGSVYLSRPEVTRIQVFKAERRLQLISERTLLKEYGFELGFEPEGHKTEEGDGRTPEGAYRIDRRNPNSRFHLSLGISYPNQSDIAAAQARGVKPGGDIFIHGTPKKWIGMPDWTWGCIAVTNLEMEEIYPMVQVDTKIFIYS